jgi:hypothetical protein
MKKQRLLDKTIYILPHQGLGDLNLCIGIFRNKSREYSKVRIIVRHPFDAELRSAFSRTPSVSIITIPRLPTGLIFRRIELLVGYCIGLSGKILGGDFLPLGYLGRKFFGATRELRFDESFYNQAGVAFSERWDSFEIDFDTQRVQALSRQLGAEEGEFVFLHEDRSRGFKIDRTLLPAGLRVIEPLSPDSGFNIWDYKGVAQRATEIHMIESSFAAFVESLDIAAPKFAHRYARPEAKGDWNHEFTYRQEWKVLL